MISASARTSCPTTMPCSSGGTLPSCSRLLVTTTELLSFRTITGSACWRETPVRTADPMCLASEHSQKEPVCLPGCQCRNMKCCIKVLLSVTHFKPQSVLPCSGQHHFYFPFLHQEVSGPQDNLIKQNVMDSNKENMESTELCHILEAQLPLQKLPPPVEPDSIPIGPLCWIAVCNLRFPQITPGGSRQAWSSRRGHEN